MSLRETFEFVDTEEEAIEMCKTIQRNQNSYRKMYRKPNYTPWTSQDGKEHKYVVWHYTRQKGGLMSNKYYEVGYRLTSAQRQELKNRGYHVYSTRSWDEGYGCTLEHRVLVNHESDVITNFAALDDNNPEDRVDDFYEYMGLCNAESDLDVSKIKDILDY